MRTGVLGSVLAVVVASFTSLPAVAEEPPATEILSLDASTPGKVTATIASSGPWLRVSIGGIGEKTYEIAGPTTKTIELETWGFDATSLVAATCGYETQQTNNCYPQDSEAFTATDVRPTVTFTTDGILGANETVGVTVDDPGGGPLAALSRRDGGFGQSVTAVANHGTTQVTPVNGEGDVSVVRCSSYVELGNQCVDFDPVAKVHVKAFTSLHATAGGGIQVTLTRSSPTTQIPITANDAHGTYDLVWQLRAGPFAARTGTASGTINDDFTLPPLTIDADGVADGDYYFVAAVTVHDPVFGDVTGVAPGPQVRVRKSIHTVTGASVDHSKIWPMVGSARYPGKATVTVTTADPVVWETRLEVLGPDGNVVERLDTDATGPRTVRGTWNGFRSVGGLAPSGTYRVRLVNEWGNVTPTDVTITVSRARLSPRTYQVTVSPNASLDDFFVGRCSTLRKPSLRKWPGSLGFYANTKCKKQTWNASAVSTLHAVKVPAAAEYRDIQVTVTGGAARAKPRSRAFIRYLTTKRTWVDDWRTGWRLGTHRGARDSATPLIWGDRYFVWGFGTASNARWDVKSFTVVLRYYVLEG